MGTHNTPSSSNHFLEWLSELRNHLSLYYKGHCKGWRCSGLELGSRAPLPSLGPFLQEPPWVRRCGSPWSLSLGVIWSLHCTGVAKHKHHVGCDGTERDWEKPRRPATWASFLFSAESLPAGHSTGPSWRRRVSGPTIRPDRSENFVKPSSKTGTPAKLVPTTSVGGEKP